MIAFFLLLIHIILFSLKTLKLKRILLLCILIVSLSFSSLAQDCDHGSTANDLNYDKPCAPVSVTWEVTYRGVHDAGTVVEIQVDWDDGNPPEIQVATNTNVATAEWQHTFSHVFPIGGDQCNYNVEANLIVNGQLCTSSTQTQSVTVWDTDDYNGGVLAVDPQVFPICVGNEDGTVFNDLSIWNCTPAGGENDKINSKTRWTQWVYGTNYTINNVTVAGAVQSYPYWDGVVEATEYVDAPQPPNNVSEFCNSPITGQVGEFFEVTLRNWNFCNPYDDPDIAGPPADPINGDFPPIEITAMILIVDTPQTAITPVGPFCENDNQVWLNGTPGGGVWNGAGTNSSGRFRPWVAGPGIHTITYTTTDPTYGCDGTATIQVEVFAAPTPNLPPNQEVCPGDVLNLDGSPTLGDGAIISHLWTGNTGPLNFTNIQTPVFTTNTQGLYNLTYTVTDDNGCAGTDVLAVNVNPVSANIIPDPAEVCLGEDLILNGNPSGGTGNYTTHVWTGDVAELDVSNLQSVTFNSANIGVFNFNYTVTDDNGCTGTDDIVVTVFEVPIADAGLNDSTCSLNIQLSSNPSLGTGLWSQISGLGTVSFDDASLSNAQISVDQYGVYELVWEEAYGPNCTDSDTVEIRFTEQPIADAGPDGGVCGYDYQLNAIASVGTGFWSVLNGPGILSFTDVSSPTTSINSDVYGDYQLIWYEDNGYGCEDEDTVVVSFNLVPTPAFIPVNPDGCTPFTVDFTNQSIGETTYHWDFGNGNTTTLENPTETFYNNTSADLIFDITLIINNPGCGDTLMQNITVHPLPTAQFTHNATPECSPLNVDFVSQSIGATWHIWDFDDGSLLDTGITVNHTFVNDTVFIINYAVDLIAVSDFSCKDTTTHFVTVYPNPDYDITATPDSSCHPATVLFSTQPGAQTYQWIFGNGTSEIGNSQVQSQYINLGITDITYDIELITSSYLGCVDTSSTQIVVHPSPVIDFSVLNSSVCAPFEVAFVNNSSGSDTYVWDFGDGESSTSLEDTVKHTFTNSTSNPITYYIELTGENTFGCTGSLVKTVLVYPEVNVEFTADTISCHPFSNQMVNLSNGASNYIWNFGDGLQSTSTNPVHIYNNLSPIDDTIFKTVLTAYSTFGCSASDSIDVRVLPKPHAQFDLIGENGCTPYLQNILNNSVGADTYLWDFGDGNQSSDSSSTLSHEYVNNLPNTTFFNIALSISNDFGCIDQAQSNIEVFPKVTALFTSDSSGCNPLPIDFINQSSGATNYFWNFGNGTLSNDINPAYVFENLTLVNDTFTVNLIANSGYGCSDTASKKIVVYPQPTALFNVQTATQTYPNTNFVFFNLTTGQNWDWNWDFGDGQSSQIRDVNNHSYSTWGSYDIWLTVSGDYCADSIKRTVTIISPEPTADFDFSPKSGCVPLKVTITNHSLSAENYYWDFGDGFDSEAFEPVHVYYDPGVYYIHLTATGENGVDEKSLGPIHVYDTPEAHIEVSPTTVYIPDQPIKCFNLSLEEDSVIWYFGDGETSVEDNPIHFYKEEGSYQVMLVALTKEMCNDTAYSDQKVDAKSLGDIDFPNAFKPVSSGSSGGRYPTPDYENRVFHPVFRGVIEYELNIFNRWGELIFVSNDINIGWDGYYRGELCKQDVYVWKVDGKYINGQQFTKAGDLTLLR